MMRYINPVAVLFLALFFIQCGKDNGDRNVQPGTTDNWLIPIDQVRDGGPGKDGIPSIDNPKFEHISTTSYLADSDLVVVSKLNNQVYVYPHVVMDWHEIVNHFPGSQNLTMTYCPLTGTAIGWNPMVNGTLTEFGVSGLLYNSNLMPYDRQTNSTWSQMRLDCVNGTSINTKIEVIHLIETKFETVKTLFPDAMVMTTNTGINRNYGQYPYGSYRTNDQLIFPIDGELDESLHPKERILGVQVDDEAIGFQFDSFDADESIVVEARLSGRDIVTIGNKSLNFMVAFENQLHGQKVTLSGIMVSGEGIAEDTSGNVYNVFGEIISGPDQGSQLKGVTNYIGYWFAWAAFADGISLME